MKKPKNTVVYRLDITDDEVQTEVWLDNSSFEKTGIPCISDMSACGDKIIVKKEVSSQVKELKYPEENRFPLLCVDINTKEITGLADNYKMFFQSAMISL